MNEFLAVILIVVIIIIFNNLNNKIRKLEKEISDLHSKIGSPSLQNDEVIKETPDEKIQPQPTPVTYREEVSPNHEKLPPPPQKDWLGPVFDFLKQNILTIVGIFTLVLGIGYFVKYAIDKNWIGETARAGIGFFIGATIILIGHFLRKNYTTFASIITGGGIAVLYFTATIAFREYHLFTQNTAFLITILITAISIILSYYYKSEILIIFSLIGGFSAPLMISTGQSNYLFLFIYLTLLNIGMLAVTFLKHWKSVGWTAYVFTTLYLLFWTSEKPELLSIVFYIISYIIFYIFALYDYIKKNVLSTWDILMLALINFTSIIGLVYTFDELKYEPATIFPIGFALINTILLFREYRKKNAGTSFSVFAGITVSLITIAVALQFKTHLITSVWAIEATLLLFIWKKTGHKIFKTCFHILFPLVIIAQMITWTEYFNAKNLSIILNPVFLTSLVTVFSAIVNLYLLKDVQKDTSANDNSFFEDLITVASYGIIYTALLLEIIYHIQNMHWAAITSVALLFSMYYIFILLLFRKVLHINIGLQIVLIYLFLFLLIINVSITTSSVVTSILTKNLGSSFYLLHLLQWIPFIYIGFKIIPSSDFHKNKISYWALSLALITSVSCELHHAYVLTASRDFAHSFEIKKHFNILYLPIIWTILASILIYTGLKKNIQEYNKIGFALVGIMVLKLYGYDVWQMDNISRISAFIVLGVILLLSSFTFQRLKNIIKNMVDKKDKNEEPTSL
ncbi:DUF2339 domain-containing protein [Chryseobacterium lactis]|uniref:DUF2339 domain-containing protein n=1 Tax=Chryseobacterium lactis TaxID=1241981 RepID=A0A3G6RHN3_CHRLC|nr:DUF2339 domain-containing protein [Chryseobacterium lactis]AZA83000.1 DUF2339 domain-containing protein [Chryseobacterium lactis]AZB03383.1 DUF2339 domain-containing protein [Chryseobacterium lactis]PNW12331.1 DUF2339 domain-containing protein [Chryseobacterium lactis]